MRYGCYLKERFWQLLLLAGLLLTVEIFLLTAGGGLWLGIYVGLCFAGFYFIVTFADCRAKKRYWEEMEERLSALDKKYLVAELTEKGGNQEERLLNELLSDIGKAMTDYVNGYRHAQEEYKEYIELWIHEVKLPVAAGKLIVENNRNPVTESLEEELDKLEDYTEQALFYARSSHVEKDYLIGEVCLREVVNEVLRRNKRALISSGAELVRKGLDTRVYSDGKWLAFILNQIVSNSVKYADKRRLRLEFEAGEEKESSFLLIRDNGRGIPERDLPRVFEKGFTGIAGREMKKATGLGLYLSRKLCQRLGIGILVSSREGEGTCVRLVFPRGSFSDIRGEAAAGEPSLQK